MLHIAPQIGGVGKHHATTTTTIEKKRSPSILYATTTLPHSLTMFKTSFYQAEWKFSVYCTAIVSLEVKIISWHLVLAER